MLDMDYPVFTRDERANRKPIPFTVPWELMAAHELQAQHNHGQSIGHLAARGGVSPSEAVAILENRSWHPMSEKDAVDRLRTIVARYDVCASCSHPDFEVHVAVNRLEDNGRFNADVRINCCACGSPFRFYGLPVGLNLDGAAVSVDGTEARLAIGPIGRVPPKIKGVTGFTVTKKESDGGIL